jgi:ABC-type multidrug transport system fused ATPase/permease subunit
MYESYHWQHTMRESIIRYVRRIVKPASHNNPDTLLHSIVWIAGVSIATILALSAVAVYEITSREVIRDAKDAAVRVSRSMFEQQRAVLTSVDSNGEYQLHPDQANAPEIDHYFRTFLRNFDIIKIKIYTSQNTIIYSTDRKIIGKTDSRNRRLKRALGGEVYSRLMKKEWMLDLSDETKFNVSVVETYIPIRAGNRIIGAFELYTDVTPYSQEIIHIVAMTLICLAVILLFVFACSYLVIRKATRLLKVTQQELADKVRQLEEALANVKQLEGIIPICMHCKKIRDDMESWQQLELYISSHTEARFSHGICPECFEKQMIEIKAMTV